MHSKLWEREVDTFFIEGFVNCFICIEIDTPVISAVYPDTCHYIHTAGIQGMKSYKRSWFIQDTFIGGQNITNYLLNFIVIFPIIYTNNPFYTATGIESSKLVEDKLP